MGILGKIFSAKVTIFFSSKNYFSNNSNNIIYYIKPKCFHFKKRSTISINTKIDQSNTKSEFLLISPFGNIIHKELIGREYFFDLDNNSSFFVVFKIYPKEKLVLNAFEIYNNVSKSARIEAYCKETNLNLTLDDAPSVQKKQLGFLSKNGIDVCNLKVSSNASEAYIDVTNNFAKVSYNDLRMIIHKKELTSIILNGLNDSILQVLEAVDLSNTNVILYLDNKKSPNGYLNTRYKKIEKKSNIILINQISRFKKIKNNHIFCRTMDILRLCKNAEEDNAQYAPYIIDDGFIGLKKLHGDRIKNICMIRKFDDISDLSAELDVRIINELNKNPHIRESTSFNIYGTGQIKDDLLSLISGSKNINIYNYNPSVDDIFDIYSKNDIVLIGDKNHTQIEDVQNAAASGIYIATTRSESSEEIFGKDYPLLYSDENFTEAANNINRFINSKNNKSIEISAHLIDNYKKYKKAEIRTLNSTAKNSMPRLEKISKKPVLTVAIPSYNVAPYLKKCVSSIIDNELAGLVEVLIINDGSKDNTINVATDLKKSLDDSRSQLIKIIDKENGGHGSTINAAIREASGKYFRLLDGDDYFYTENMTSYLNALSKMDADIILTDLVEDYSISAIKVQKYYYNFLQPNIIYDLDDICTGLYGFYDWGPLLSTTTCRTNILKDSKFHIDENCFYVDMEYNFIIYCLSKSLCYLPLNIYNYNLGREGQSMSRDSMIKNCLHHEKVSLRLIEELYNKEDVISAKKRDYIINRMIRPLCKAQYRITSEYFNNGKNFMSFDTKMKKYPEFYNDIEIAGRVTKLHRITSGSLIFADRAIKKIASIIFRR